MHATTPMNKVVSIMSASTHKCRSVSLRQANRSHGKKYAQQERLLNLMGILLLFIFLGITNVVMISSLLSLHSFICQQPLKGRCVATIDTQMLHLKIHFLRRNICHSIITNLLFYQSITLIKVIGSCSSQYLRSLPLF